MVTVKTKELLQICEKLPVQKMEEVVDFARFLHHQADSKTGIVENTGDKAWEQIIHNPRPRPKLDAFVKKAISEGEAEPLDPKKL